jgi:hypothetical protein
LTDSTLLAAFATWAPKLHNKYATLLEEILQLLPHLERNFANSVFACATANFGPHTATFRHFDSQNLAYGWCAITALGSYDYTKGGHLILWESQLVLEFPPGCTILIPSASISHSNIGILEEEKRYSFTQYTAGALFRWVDRIKYSSVSEQEDENVEKYVRNGLSLFSTHVELQN